jgi:predicted SprT family Zn-dependent metalloprotease
MTAILMVQEQIFAQCQIVLAKAARLFPTLDLDIRGVDVLFNLKGTKIGVSKGLECGGYQMKFNLDYGVVYPHHIVNETVPHEVAHIVRFKAADDNSHGKEWRNIAVALGASGDTTHPLPLIFKGKTIEYTTTRGYHKQVSEHVHRKIQAGAAYDYGLLEGIVNKNCYFFVVSG